jgi:chromosome segregation ATPase
MTSELLASKCKCEESEQALHSSKDRENAFNLELRKLKAEHESSQMSADIQQTKAQLPKIEELKSEISEWNTALKVEREKLESLQTELSCLHDKHNQLLSESDSKDAKITELETKLDDFVEQIRELYKQVNGYVAETNILNTQVRVIRSEKEATEKACKDEINKLQQKLKRAKEKMQEILKKQKEELEVVAQEREGFKIQLGVAAEEKENIESELSITGTARDEYAATFNTLGKQVSRFQYEVERLEVENENLKSLLVNDKQGNVQEMEDLTARNSDLLTKISSLKDERKQLEKNCREYLQSCNDLQEETVIQKLAIEKQKELVEELTLQLNELNGESVADVAKLREDLSLKEEALNVLQETLVTHKHEIETRDVCLGNLVGQSTVAKVESATSSNVLQDVRGHLFCAEESIASLKEEGKSTKMQHESRQYQQTETETLEKNKALSHGLHDSMDYFHQRLQDLTEQLDQMAREQELVVSELALATTTRDEYAASLNILTEQVCGFESEVERLEIENQNLKSVLANSKLENVKEMEDLVRLNNELSANVTSFERTIGKLERNCIEYLQSSNDLQEENISQKLEIEKGRALACEMRQQLDDLNDVQQLIQTLPAEIQRLRKGLTAKENDIISQQVHVKELIDQLSDLEDENRTLAAKFQQLEEGLSAKEADLILLQERFDGLAASIQVRAELTEEVLGLQHKLEELECFEKENKCLHEEIESLHGEQAEFEYFKANNEALACYDDRVAEMKHLKEDNEKLASQVDELLQICDKYKENEDGLQADKHSKGEEVERLHAGISTLKEVVQALEDEKKRIQNRCSDLERRHQIDELKNLGSSDLQEAYEDLANKLVAVEKENKELEEISHNLKDLCAGFKDENVGLRQSLDESAATVSRLEATVRDFEREFDYAQEQFVGEVEKMKEKMKLEVESMQSGYDQALENVRHTMEVDKELLLKNHEEEIEALETLAKDNQGELEKMKGDIGEHKKEKKNLKAAVIDLQDQRCKIIDDMITSREELNTLKTVYEKDLCEAAERYEHVQLENRALQDNYADLGSLIENMRAKHEENCKSLQRDIEVRNEFENAHLQDQLRKYEVEVLNLRSGLDSSLLPEEMYILRSEHERFVADQKANYEAIVCGYDAALRNVTEGHAEEITRLKIEADQVGAALRHALGEGSLPEEISVEKVHLLESIEEQPLSQELLENVCFESSHSAKVEICPEMLDTLSTSPEQVLGSASLDGQAPTDTQIECRDSTKQLIASEVSEDITAALEHVEATSIEGHELDERRITANVANGISADTVELSGKIPNETAVSAEVCLEEPDGLIHPQAVVQILMSDSSKKQPGSSENYLEDQMVAEQVISVSSEVPSFQPTNELTPGQEEHHNIDVPDDHNAVTLPLGAVALQVPGTNALSEGPGGEHSDALPLEEKLSQLQKKLAESDKLIKHLEEALKAKETENVRKTDEQIATFSIDLREMQSECDQLVEERDTMKVKCEQDIKNLQNEHDTEIQRLKDLVYEYDDVKEKQVKALTVKHLEELEELRFEVMQENEEIEHMRGNNLEELLTQEQHLRDQYQEELDEVRLELNIQSEEQKQAVEELNEEIEFLKSENEKLRAKILSSHKNIRDLEGMLGNSNLEVPEEYAPWEEDLQAGEELARSLSPNAELAGKSILQEVCELEGVPDSSASPIPGDEFCGQIGKGQVEDMALGGDVPDCPASPIPGDEIWGQIGKGQVEDMALGGDVPGSPASPVPGDEIWGQIGQVEEMALGENVPVGELKKQIEDLEARHEFETKQLREHLKDQAEIEKMRLRAEIEIELRYEKRQYKEELDLELKKQLKAMKQEQEMKFIEEFQKSRSEMLRNQDDKIEAIRKKFSEQSLHQVFVESTDELEDVVHKLQLENVVSSQHFI